MSDNTISAASAGTGVAMAKTTATSQFTPGDEYSYPADKLVIPSKGHPLFNAARTLSNEGVDKLVASMKDKGWGNIPPVLVQFDELGDAVVVAGIRRTKAARQVGIEAQIKVLDPNLPVSELLSINIQENENRTDTNPMAKAESFNNFIQSYVAESLAEEFPDATEYTAKAVTKATTRAKQILAVKVKLAKETIDEYLQLMNLGSRARKYVIDGTLKRVDVSDRGAGLTRMILEDGSPDEDAQEAALEKLVKHTEETGAKPSRKELKAVTKGEAVGFKPKAWEINQMITKMEEATEAGTEDYSEQLNLIRFLRGDLTLRTAKKRMSWLKDVFVAKAGPGVAED